MEGNVRPLDRDDVRGILQRGGTILGTSRRDPYVHGEGGGVGDRARSTRDGIDAVVVVGGDGTLRTALRSAAEGVPLVGVPKTIDNDIAATDVTFGFDTAVQIATEAIDRITTTAESHDRIMVVEVMGRTKGWIATYAGHRRGSRRDPRPGGSRTTSTRSPTSSAPGAERGRRYSVVVVAEGVAPPGGDDLGARRRRVRVRAARRRLSAGGGAARGADRVRDARHRARAPPARRDADGRRPGARHPARRRGGRPRRGGPVRRMVALRGTSIVDVPLDEACAGIRRCRPRSSTSPGRSRRREGAPRRDRPRRHTAASDRTISRRTRAALTAAAGVGNQGRGRNGPLTAIGAR